MAIPNSELSDAIIASLEIDGADLNRFKVYENINSAQDELVGVLPFTELESIIESLLIDTVGAQQRYAWPDGTLYSSAREFVRFVEVHLSTDQVPITDLAPGFKCIKYERERHPFPITTYGTDQIPFVDINEKDEFRFFPAPVGTIIPGIRLDYVGKAVRVSNTISCELNYRLKNFVLYRATQLSCLVEEYRIKMSGDFKKLADNELKKLLPKGGK